MLSDRYDVRDLTSMLIPPRKWHPYPTIEDRAAWNALPRGTREFYVDRAEHALGYDWPTQPATLFLEFQRTGNRSHYEHVNHLRRSALRELTLAEAIEGEGRFLDDIANGIWATCEETYWGYPAHVSIQRAGVGLPDVEEPTVDLFAAETVAQLAWTLYLLGDRLDAVSPLIRRRVRYEAKRRVLDACFERDDFWWMGLRHGGEPVNNWNPWINSNWITAVLLLEEDAERRAVALHKILSSLDVFLDAYAEDGGCDEGPGYWGRAAASLFDCLDLLCSATGGGLDVFEAPKVRNMGAFIYRTQIHDAYYVNFADASALNRPPGSLVYRYGRSVRDADMMAFGTWLMAGEAGARGAQRVRGTHEDSLGRILPALFDVVDPPAVAPAQPLPRDVWFGGIQVMAARDVGGTADGLFVAAKAGHNGESHNHNDVGNVLVYVDGKPVIVDAGVETYRRQTFSPQRYEIWTMQSAYHTLLPTLKHTEGSDAVWAVQAPGETYAARDVAYEADEAHAALTLDLAGAYPTEAGIDRWQRTITLSRGVAVDVEDAFVLRDAPSEVALALLTPCDVEIAAGTVGFRATPFGPSEHERQTGAGTLAFDADVFEVEVERIEIDDARLRGVWGDHLNHIVFTATSPPAQATWHWRFRAMV